MPERVVMLAIDGLDGGRVRGLVDAGRCPALARVLREGAYADVAVTACTPGLIGAERAMNSPTLWTTVATGQYYFQHGVHDFSNVLDSIEHPPLFESRHVRSPRIWDVLSARGIASVVVGYYVTHPAYAINGVMVSDLFGETEETGVVSPPGLLEELVRVLGAESYTAYRDGLGSVGSEQGAWDSDASSAGVTAQVVMHEALHRFAELNEQQSTALLGGENLEPARRLLRYRLVYPFLRDERMHRVFLHLLGREAWGFATCYYRLVDFVSHGFWGGGHGLPGEFQKAFDNTLERVYECVDRWIAEVQAILEPGDRLVVLSDHGFTAAGTAQSAAGPRLNPAATEGEHAEPAFLAVTGGPRAGRLEPLTLLDIAPSILDFFGVEQAESLDGGPVPGLLAEKLSAARARVPDYPYDPPTRAAEMTAADDNAVRRRLAALGYLET